LNGVLDSFLLDLLYSVALFPVSCFVAACLSIPCIFLILSRKKRYAVISLISILIIWCVFFAINSGVLCMLGFSGVYIVFVAAYNAFVIPVSLVMYSILLLLEKFPKFRVPQTLITQSNLYKKYIKIFYYYYFVLVCAIIAAALKFMF